jgi:hypothetical protein
MPQHPDDGVRRSKGTPLTFVVAVVVLLLCGAVIAAAGIQEGVATFPLLIFLACFLLVTGGIAVGLIWFWTRIVDQHEERYQVELERFGTPRGLRYVYQPEVVEPAPLLGGCPRSLRGLVGTIAGCPDASLVHHDPFAEYGRGIVAQHPDLSPGTREAFQAMSVAVGRPSAGFGPGQARFTILRLPLASTPAPALPDGELDGFAVACESGVLAVAAHGFLTSARELSRLIAFAEGLLEPARA